MRASRTVTIRRSPRSVFCWIENPELASRWQPEVAGYEVVRASPDVVGTEFRERLQGAGGSMEMLGRVTSYERDARMGFELVGKGIHVRAEYALAPATQGTQLRADVEVRAGGILSALVGPFVQRRLVKQLEAELQLLRTLCETSD